MTVSKEILERFRKKVAQTFGVTVIDNMVTLRFSDEHDSNRRLEVTMVVLETFDSDVKKCDYCCGITASGKLYETNVTTKLCSGEMTHKVNLCYDCFCPQ